MMTQLEYKTMRMERQKKRRELITPTEALALSEFNTAADLYRAHDIVTAWGKRHKNDSTFDYMCMCAMIYTAGRVQGIREERAKRKQK